MAPEIQRKLVGGEVLGRERGTRLARERERPAGHGNADTRGSLFYVRHIPQCTTESRMRILGHALVAVALLAHESGA